MSRVKSAHHGSFTAVRYGFFFQAEDGIRDGHVTGVQTCALPIFGKCFFGGAAPDKNGRGMTRIDEFEMAVIIEQTKEHRSIAAHLGMLAKKAVHVIENARWIGAERHAGKRALQHGGQNGGTESFAGNVGNDKRRAPIAYAKNVEIVA